MTSITPTNSGPAPHVEPLSPGRPFLVAVSGLPPLLAAAFIDGMAVFAEPARLAGASLGVSALLLGWAVSLCGVVLLLALPRPTPQASLAGGALCLLAALAAYGSLAGTDPSEMVRGMGVAAGAVLLGLSAAMALIPTPGEPLA